MSMVTTCIRFDLKTVLNMAGDVARLVEHLPGMRKLWGSPAYRIVTKHSCAYL